jgi:hypothetical protein
MRRELLVLGGAPADVVPRSFGTDEDVHIDLDTGVAVHGSERHTVHFSGGRAAQRAATATTEAKAPSESGFVVAQIVFTGNP